MRVQPETGEQGAATEDAAAGATTENEGGVEPMGAEYGRANGGEAEDDATNSSVDVMMA